jgi:hypothetical protein
MRLSLKPQTLHPNPTNKLFQQTLLITSGEWEIWVLPQEMVNFIWQPRKMALLVFVWKEEE